MTPARRNAAAAVVLAVLSAAAMAWQVNGMLGQREAARRAAEDLAACRALAADIVALRAQPHAAGASDLAAPDLGQRIEASARHAGLDLAALEGVYPQAARRAGDSVYLEKPTTLAWRGVGLVPLAGFLHHLAGNSGLSVSDLRIRTPRGDVDSRLWDVEATVTYLVYAPATESRRQR